MILGLIVSYMILASQFNSFIHPFAVLMSLPFSIAGAFLGLLIFHQTLNIYSLMGFILLLGIVKKNSIFLGDFTNQERARGAGVAEALLAACPLRLRAIFMTSATTLVAALPLALSIGPASEIMRPMGIVVIGGVLISTLFTLFVVPCTYQILADWEAPPYE